MFINQKEIIRKIIREEIDNLNEVHYFLRWTSDVYDDMRRNFSGHMQAWYDTEEEAMNDYNERIANGYYVPYPPRKDITTGMWSSEPEWGLSGYEFHDEKIFNDAMSEINDIAWHHKELLNQDLCVFKSDNYILGDGFDGEDVFKDVKTAWYIEPNMSYNDVISIINKPS